MTYVGPNDWSIMMRAQFLPKSMCATYVSSRRIVVWTLYVEYEHYAAVEVGWGIVCSLEKMWIALQRWKPRSVGRRCDLFLLSTVLCGRLVAHQHWVHSRKSCLDPPPFESKSLHAVDRHVGLNFPRRELDMQLLSTYDDTCHLTMFIVCYNHNGRGGN